MSGNEIIMPQEMALAFELSVVEKQQILESLEVIKTSRGFSSYESGRQNAAKEQIVRIGFKALPFLNTQLSQDEDRFLYSTFVDALATKDSLSLVLQNLVEPNVVTNRDGSTAGRLLVALDRIIQELKSLNTDDELLSDIAMRLIGLIKEPNLNQSSTLRKLLDVINLTGSRCAVDYFSNLREELLSIAPNLPNPEQYQTWQDVLFAREALARHKLQNRTSSYWNFDEDDGIDESQPYTLLANEEEAVDRVYETLSGQSVTESIQPTVRLWLFNYFMINPVATESQVKSMLSRISNLSNQEIDLSPANNPLPTIGIELEIPNLKSVNDRSRKILEALGVPNYDEGDLLEVNPDYSYNAAAQARLIQELTRMNAIMLNKSSTTPKVAGGEPISLHINLGVPPEVAEVARSYEKHVYALNDAMIIGFVSPHRILQRKTATSLSWKSHASPSAKTHNHSSISSSPGNVNVLRMELRAFEFKDFPTYRLLLESQRLTAALFCYIKFDSKMNYNPLDFELALIWSLFYKEITSLFTSKSINANMVDSDPVELMRLITDTDIKDQVRQIITKYSMRVSDQLAQAFTVPTSTQSPQTVAS